MKKLQKAIKLERYISFMDYFATGEGRTIEINFCYAANPREAKAKHKARFYPGNMDAWEYFGPDVEVANTESKRATRVITAIFNNPDIVLDALNKAGVELHFRFHFNYS